MTHRLKAPKPNRLELKRDDPLSSFAIQFNLCPYTMAPPALRGTAGSLPRQGGHNLPDSIDRHVIHRLNTS